MDADLRAQFADVLEGQQELNRQSARLFELLNVDTDRHARLIAELRDDLLALANRVEAIARATLDDGREHSVRVAELGLVGDDGLVYALDEHGRLEVPLRKVPR